MRTSVLALSLAAFCFSSGPLAAQEAEVPSRLSLGDALRLVQERHPGLSVASERVTAAQASKTAAGQRPNPALTFSSEGVEPWTPGGRSIDSQELVVSVQQEFETGGRRGLRRAVAEAGVAAAQASYDEERRQVRVETARSYFALVLGRLEVENARTALAEVDAVIGVNRSRYRQGEVSGVELRRLEVERMRFSDDLLAAELTERNARATLLSMLGAARLDAALEPTDGFGSPGPPAAGAEEQRGGEAATATARALEGRPDLLATRSEHQRAASELALQRAIRLPNVTFGAGYRRDFGQNGLAVIASVPLPLFSRNAGGIARADAEQRAATGAVRQAERRVSLEVQLAANTLKAMRARLTSIESDYLQKAKEARDSALAAYRSGATDLIDYLDAQRAYRDVQRAWQRAQFDVRIGLLQLDAAAGVLPRDFHP